MALLMTPLILHHFDEGVTLTVGTIAMVIQRGKVVR